MTYEKAELVLQQLMARDRDYYLVEGKPSITDSPNGQQRIVAVLPRKQSWLNEVDSKILEEVSAGNT